jgi:hypothetical protein
MSTYLTVDLNLLRLDRYYTTNMYNSRAPISVDFVDSPSICRRLSGSVVGLLHIVPAHNQRRGFLEPSLYFIIVVARIFIVTLYIYL